MDSNGQMARIEIFLSSRDDPQLMETHFEYGEGARECVKKASRGLDEGTFNRDYGSFTWTRAVQAITVCFLRWAAWGRRSKVDRGASPPDIQGKRGSLAATLNYALTKKPQWLSDVFGCSVSGSPQIEFIKRSNPDFKTDPNSPVRVFLDCSQLPPEHINVFINGKLIDKSEALDELARKVVSKHFEQDLEVLSAPNEEFSLGRAHSNSARERIVSLPVVMNAPHPPELLIGRETDLENLTELLKVSVERQTRGLCVVRGWPGVGKSSVVAALAHARDVSHVFPDGILWVSLGQKANLLLELSTWARYLRVSSLVNAATVREASARLHEFLVDKCMLLIVDDVWEVDHAEAFRVGGRRCAMLVTTRVPSVAEALVSEQNDVYVLPVLDEAHSLELLSALAPMTRDHPSEARQLVKDLEGLPLAVKVAGQLLRTEMKMGWGIGDLLRDLHNETVILDTNAPSDCADLVSQTTPTVAALLRKSTDRLDPTLRDYFALLGPFAPKPASFDLRALAAMWEVKDPKPIVRSLVNRGLLEPAEEGRFQMHALLVTHARSLLAE